MKKLIVLFTVLHGFHAHALGDQSPPTGCSDLAKKAYIAIAKMDPSFLLDEDKYHYNVAKDYLIEAKETDEESSYGTRRFRGSSSLYARKNSKTDAIKAAEQDALAVCYVGYTNCKIISSSYIGLKNGYYNAVAFAAGRE